MKRAQFEHVIRAADAVLGVSELLVIGSQAVHGSMAGELPIEAARSGAQVPALDERVRTAVAARISA